MKLADVERIIKESWQGVDTMPSGRKTFEFGQPDERKLPRLLADSGVWLLGRYLFSFLPRWLARWALLDGARH